MWVYICLVCVVCGIELFFSRLNYKISYKGVSNCICIHSSSIGDIVVFCIIFLFAAVRDGIGIDYVSYYEHIIMIQNGLPHYMEPGFQELVHIMMKLSDNPRWVIIVMSFFTCLFYFMTARNLSNNVPMSLFIFMTWGYYFFTFNTIRNYFAYCVVLYSLVFLKDNKQIKFLICIIVATLFHKSALVCIPIYLLAFYGYRKSYLLIFVGIIIVANLFQEQLKLLAFLMYPGYEGSVYDNERVSYLNILKQLLIISLGLLFYKYVKNDKINKICFNLNVLALAFYVGFYWVPEVSRIGYYMNITSVIFIPRLLSDINNQIQNKRVITMMMVIVSSIVFYVLMSGWYSETIKLLPYQTWIESGF